MPLHSAMNRRSHRLVEFVAVVAVLLLLPAAVMLYPFVHNYHLVPMARLAKRVHPGDDCGAAARAFAAYYEARRGRGNDDVQFTDGRTLDDHAFQRLVPPRRLLHLYDLTLFDDVQLTAICDPAGQRVERVFYLGD
jgi:hypothetical protein